MKASEFLNDSRKEILNDFIHFCYKELELKGKLPLIRFSTDTTDTRKNHRMGFYDPNQDLIWIYVKNRNMADILRTLCHEFVHTKQRIEDRMGENTAPDSPIEKEADMVAGQLMKKYGKINRSIYD